MTVVLIAIACGAIAVLYGAFTSSQVLKSSAGNERMIAVAAAIQEGAKAYLLRQYSTIAVVGVVVAALVYFFLGPIEALGFVIGAVLSGAAGFIGMNVSVRSNVRTAEGPAPACSAATVAFRAGAITRQLVAGLPCSPYRASLPWSRSRARANDPHRRRGARRLAFGRSLISIFARLGGGIFTKPPTRRRRLVGKVEAADSRDDPRTRP